MAEFASVHEFAAGRAALGRAVEQAQQRPSLWESDLGQAPLPGECLRCRRDLDQGRQAICTDCTEEPS